MSPLIVIVYVMTSFASHILKAILSDQLNKFSSSVLFHSFQRIDSLLKSSPLGTGQSFIHSISLTFHMDKSISSGSISFIFLKRLSLNEDFSWGFSARYILSLSLSLMNRLTSSLLWGVRTIPSTTLSSCLIGG